MVNEDALQKKVHVLDNNENAVQTVQLINVDSGSAYDDEISLIDLWLVLSRRRNMLLAIVLAFLVSGVSFAMLKPVLYKYNAVLQVGLMSVEGADSKPSYIEIPANVLEKLTKSYIPLVLSEYLQTHPELKSAPKLKASMAKKSDLITLEIKGKETESAEYRGIIQRVIAHVQADHQPQMDITKNRYERLLQKEKIAMSDLENPLTLKIKRKQLETDLLQANIQMENLKDQRLVKVLKQEFVTQKKVHHNKLASLGDEFKRLTSQQARLDDVDRLLGKRITELSGTIENEQRNRQLSVKSINSGPEAMTVLLLDNQIQSNRNELAKLEERLNITQQNQREKISNQLKDNTRSQEYHQKLVLDINNKLKKMDINNQYTQQKVAVNQSALQLGLEQIQLEHQNNLLIQQQKIDKISYQLKGLRDTQSLTSPMQSLEPVGVGKKIIVVISLLAGLFVGVFAVFFFEFISKVKEKTQQLN